MEKLPWDTEEEFYNLHSRDIFSNYPLYQLYIIGQSELEYLVYILNKLKINRSAKVVDLGCGGGYITNALNNFCECIGISTSKECIKQARLNYPDTKFEVGNMEVINVENATLFIALESLGYSNIKKTFNNVYNSLEVGGLFYIKDLLSKNKESDIEKETRCHFESYWKYKLHRVVDIINEAYLAGFKLQEFNDLSGKINVELTVGSLKYNKVEYKIPYIEFAIPAEFLFVK